MTQDRHRTATGPPDDRQTTTGPPHDTTGPPEDRWTTTASALGEPGAGNAPQDRQTTPQDRREDRPEGREGRRDSTASPRRHVSQVGVVLTGPCPKNLRYIITWAQNPIASKVKI